MASPPRAETGQKYPPLQDILFVGPYPPILGGTAAMLNRLVPALRETGIACRVINTLVGNPKGGVGARLKRLAFFARIAAKTAVAEECLVHCHAVNYANLLGHGIVLLACRATGKRTVITLHAGDLQQRFSTGPSREISRFILSMANQVTTVTPELSETLVDMQVPNSAFIANGLRYLPQGSDLTGANLPPEVEDFLASHSPAIALVGALGPIYGIDILIAALGRLRTSYPEVGALIIAFKSRDECYEKKIMNTVEASGLDDAVLFPSPFAEIAESLRRCDVFVRPSRSDGDSIAIREALALGLPTVASNVGYRPPGVRLFKTEDPDDLAAVVKDLLSNPDHGRLSATDTEAQTLDQYIATYRAALQ